MKIYKKREAIEKALESGKNVPFFDSRSNELQGIIGTVKNMLKYNNIVREINTKTGKIDLYAKNELDQDALVVYECRKNDVGDYILLNNVRRK